MYYSDDVINQVMASCDIVELIGEQVALKKNGSDYTGLCPFHSEKTPSFHVSPSKQMYYCFGCHEGGNPATFLMRYNNYTFPEAIKILAERGGVTLPESSVSAEGRAREERRKAIYDALKEAAIYYNALLGREEGSRGLDYLRGRGLDDGVIRRFGLGFSTRYGDGLHRHLIEKGFNDDILQATGLFKYDEKSGVSDRFWNRVIFPIMDERGRVIGFGGRVMGEGKPKYLNSPEGELFNKRKNLYALNIARSHRGGSILLCEGYMDVIAMHKAGFKNAVASLGTALTSEQCALLRRFTREITILYDSDEAGRNAALRAIPLITEAGMRARVADMSPMKDPDEFIVKLGREEMERRLEQAEDSFLFELGELARSHDRNDPMEWTEFQREAARKLASIPDELERENYLSAVSRKFDIPSQGLLKLTAKMAASGTSAERYSPRKNGRAPGKKEPANALAERMMIAFLAAYPSAFAATEGDIGPESFREPLNAKIAAELYRQHKGDGVNLSAVIAAFPSAEEESRAAAVLNTPVPADGAEEINRVFNETVIKMLKADYEADLAASGEDMNAFTRCLEKKRRLESIGRTQPFRIVKGDDR